MFAKVSVLMTVLEPLVVTLIVTPSIVSVTSISVVLYLHHVIIGVGTPSASQVSTAVSGDVTITATGGAVTLAATERERSVRIPNQQQGTTFSHIP